MIEDLIPALLSIRPLVFLFHAVRKPFFINNRIPTGFTNIKPAPVQYGHLFRFTSPYKYCGVRNLILFFCLCRICTDI